MESFLAATNYVRSFRGIQILSSAIEWKAFWKVHDVNDFKESITAIQRLAEVLSKKDKLKCQQLYEECKNKSTELMQQYEAFSELCRERSELCQYWDGITWLSTMLKNLFAADREGD